MKRPKPLTTGDLMKLAVNGESIPVDRLLATFAEASNWKQIYHGETSPAEKSYEAKPCEWAFVGGFRPPYEMARRAIDDLMEDNS